MRESRLSGSVEGVMTIMIPTPTLPSLLVGFSTTNFTRAAEPTLSWNQLHSSTFPEGI